jgi:hypothetical protein
VRCVDHSRPKIPEHERNEKRGTPKFLEDLISAYSQKTHEFLLLLDSLSLSLSLFLSNSVTPQLL